MKNKYIWTIIIFIIITIGIFLYFHSRNLCTYQKIDMYTAKDFGKTINTPILSINDKKTLEQISTILKESKKIAGVLSVVSPDYLLEIHSNNKSMETVYLWIGKDNTQGMYIYKDNTETGYTISKTDTDKLKKIIRTASK